MNKTVIVVIVVVIVVVVAVVVLAGGKKAPATTGPNGPVVQQPITPQPPIVAGQPGTIPEAALQCMTPAQREAAQKAAKENAAAYQKQVDESKAAVAKPQPAAPPK